MNINRCTVTGTIGDDPKFQLLDGGSAVLRFRVATTRVSADGRTSATTWLHVAAWGRLAETLAPRLAKAQRVLVDGELRTRTFAQGEDKRFLTEIMATSVEPLVDDGARIVPITPEDRARARAPTTEPAPPPPPDRRLPPERDHD